MSVCLRSILCAQHDAALCRHADVGLLDCASKAIAPSRPDCTMGAVGFGRLVLVALSQL